MHPKESPADTRSLRRFRHTNRYDALEDYAIPVFLRHRTRAAKSSESIVLPLPRINRKACPWYYRRVEQRRPDPFFEQLEADLREGVEAAERGELVSADDVWGHLYERVDDIEKSNRRSSGGPAIDAAGEAGSR